MRDLDKPALRRELLARRAAFAGPAIVPPAAFLARLRPGTVVASYVPLRGEIDPAPLTEAAREHRCVLALPHVGALGEPLRFLGWDAADALIPGPLGLHQPHHAALPLVPDIVLTPLVGFDARGNRLGFGAGFYDRAFAACPGAWRVGVAWSVQQVAALPAERWDVPLHAIVTELEWIVP